MENEPPVHVMVDLETFSTKEDAAILSIGACKFDPSVPLGMNPIIDSFEVHIDPADCQRMGMHIDVDTVLWWMHADRDEARAELLSHRYSWVDLAGALDEFKHWLGFGTLPMWGNGVAFDNVILKSAYERCNMPVPWSFYHDRCYRTVKALAPDVKIKRVGTHHSAVDDAVSQAEHLIAITHTLGVPL